MLATELISWWYLSGWQTFISHLRSHLTSIVDFFSMPSLLRTLFKPYRQIAVQPTTNSKPQAALDQFISRFIGFFARTILLIAGFLAISITAIASLIVITLWPIAPLAPFIGLILTFSGFMI